MCLFALWMAGCSTLGSATTRTAGAPAWVDRPSAALSEASFISAVGVGASRAAAIDDAYARLAQRLSVNVAATERVVDRYAHRIDGDQAPDAMKTVSLLRVIETRTDERLPGARIAATYFDRKRGEHYALAALDRREAAEAMRSEIERHLDLAEHRRALARDEPSPLRAYARLRGARASAVAAQQLAQSLSVVAPASKDKDAHRRSEALLADVDRRLDELNNSVGVLIEAASTPQRLRNIVREAVQALGLPVMLRGQAAVRLRLEYQADEVTSHAPNRRIVRWRLRLDAIDAKRMRALDSLSLTGAVEARRLGDARNEALAEAHRELERRAEAFLDEALLGG